MIFLKSRVVPYAAIILSILVVEGRGENFCFLQVSDVHIEPAPVGSPPPSSNDRSVDTIRWFCEQAKEPQLLGTVGLKTPKPAFVVCTGDLMEFGAVGATFDRFESYFKPLQIPLYLVAGNHDNTWAGIMQIMRQKHGGDQYSFDRFGCHFIIFDSATPQEPAPSIEQRTLTFLARDLEKVNRATPIFMFCHHPLSTTEYAKPHEQLRFLEAIRGYNVAALVMGHGHAPVYEKWGTLDSVMGGSTFGPHTGYNIISVQDGLLRVVYRFRDADKPDRAGQRKGGRTKLLLEKSIRPAKTPTLEIRSPESHARIKDSELKVEVDVKGRPPGKLTASLDNDPKRSTTLEGTRDGTLLGLLKLSDLTPGEHYIRFSGRAGETELDRAGAFEWAPQKREVQRNLLNAGSKAAPLALPAGLLIATTAGDLVLIDDRTRSPRTIATLGAEILHEPALAGDTIYVGCGNGSVYALALDGQVKWKSDVGASTYGTPAVDSQRVYAADLQGHVHALDRASGKPLWDKPVSGYPIEMSMLLREGSIYVGAWDGFVYALRASDGKVQWKSRSPAGQSEHKFANRYYSAADASPIAVGDHLIVADRGYKLGAYTFDGKYAGEIAANVSAPGRSENGESFYARGEEGGLTRYDAKLQKMWSNPVPLGRFPLAPLERGGRVYVCSNLGLLSVIDAVSGKTLWQYQATPQLHVMAPVALDNAGRPCVAGMDGSVTCVSAP